LPSQGEPRDDCRTDKAPFGIRQWLLLFFLFGVAFALMEGPEYWLVVLGVGYWYLSLAVIAYLAYAEFRWVWRSRDKLASFAWAVVSFIVPTALLLAGAMHKAEEGLGQLHGSP